MSATALQGEVPPRHAAVGAFCAICGSRTDGEHDRELHAEPAIRFCHTCGAGSEEPCDAGLHG